jgi:hypothetical protein
MEQDNDLRQRLDKLLAGKGAHINYDSVVKDFPKKLRCKKPDYIPYSPWQLLEHLRIAQWDILEFSRDLKHVSPPWPEGFWPKNPQPPKDEDWDHSVKQFQKDLKDMRALVADPSTDLHGKIPHGTGQNILREALLVADHNAYHVGQLMMLRKILEAGAE